MASNILKFRSEICSELHPAFFRYDDDVHFLTLALCGEVGELANFIKKGWRDGIVDSEEIRDEIADIRIYLELIAKCFDVEGEKLDERVKDKMVRHVKRYKSWVPV